MLGYNCSEQASTKVSPYRIMRAVEPIIPPTVKPRFLGLGNDLQKPRACDDRDYAKMLAIA